MAKMCKDRSVHFSMHDKRVHLATAPFTAQGGPDEYVSSSAFYPCNCDKKEVIYRIIRANPQIADGELGHSSPDGPAYHDCPEHNCCIVWTQLQPCQYYYGHQGEIDAPEECINYLLVGKQLPISAAVDGFNGTGGWAAVHWPTFPAAELFYSEHIIEEQSEHPDSRGLCRDRREVLRFARALWMRKGELQKANIKSELALRKIEAECSRWWATEKLPPGKAKELWELWGAAEYHVYHADVTEVMAAHDFARMMKYAGISLTILRKMPAPGESISSADGSYTLSREQLDLGNHNNIDAVRSACDGPLKQSAGLHSRLKQAKEDLESIAGCGREYLIVRV